MAEKRLIDADTLLETIHDTADGLADCDQQNAAWALRKYAARDIMDAPTVDAVEVVHGRWIDRIDNDTPMHECSVCGARVVKGLYEYENQNLYCYHCGARMDKEADNE